MTTFPPKATTVPSASDLGRNPEPVIITDSDRTDSHPAPITRQQPVQDTLYSGAYIHNDN
jgi:hypothetical protein